MNSPATTSLLVLLPAALALAAQVAVAETLELEEASIYFEMNHTDGDLGIHALIDGEPWRKLEIRASDASKLLDVRVHSALRDQGMTELFFESAEPDFEELAPADFFARFPAGTYLISGTTTQGDIVSGEVELSHVMPAPPDGVRVNGTATPEDCEEGEPPLLSAPVTISWDPVTGSHPDVGAAGPMSVSKYLVVLEREEPNLLVLSIELPADVTSTSLPDSFTDLAEEFKYEILVQADNGNQTALESCFALE